MEHRYSFQIWAAQGVIKKIEKYKVKIVVLQEIRWNDTGTLDIESR